MERFADLGTSDLYNGKSSKAARRVLPVVLRPAAIRKLDMLLHASSLAQLKIPPNNKLHKLKGDREGQHAICINDQYRICFVWTQKGAVNIEIANYH